MQFGATSPAPSVAPASVHAVLSSAGRPLARSDRAQLEPRLGHDLSGVRLHDDATAARSAADVGARAWTVGNRIAFAAGEYRPGTIGSDRLLLHELAHVVQQGSTSSVLRSRIAIGKSDDPQESEAERLAEAGGTTARRSFPVLRRYPVTRDPSDPARRGEMLSYRESTELLECIRIHGDDSTDFCRQEVLNESPPHPTHVAVAGITTPVPYEFNTTSRDNIARGAINGINVEIRPDAQSTAANMRNRAETTFNFNRYRINRRVGRNGNVSSFTGPGAPTLRIVTTYGRGATPAGISGYGRGTTTEDVAAGDTSLGFHEGRHGLDFMRYITEHPFPVFTGTVGMAQADFDQAMTDYVAARTQYATDLGRDSVLSTDCVGATIDASNAANGVVTTECVTTP
jgi:hypothetical protein